MTSKHMSTSTARSVSMVSMCLLGFIQATEGSFRTQCHIYKRTYGVLWLSLLSIRLGFEGFPVQEFHQSHSVGPLAWHFICCLVMVQPRQEIVPTWPKIVVWDVNHQHKQTKQMHVNQSIRWSDATNTDRQKPETSQDDNLVRER